MGISSRGGSSLFLPGFGEGWGVLWALSECSCRLAPWTNCSRSPNTWSCCWAMIACKRAAREGCMVLKQALQLNTAARLTSTSILHLTARQRAEKTRSLRPACPGLSPGRAWKDPGNQGGGRERAPLGTAGACTCITVQHSFGRARSGGKKKTSLNGNGKYTYGYVS